MTGAAVAIACALIAQALIYAGIAFLNGKLAPGLLASAYAVSAPPRGSPR